MPFFTAPYDKPSAIARAKARIRARRMRVNSWFWRQARKIVVAVTGFTIILAGIIMLVFPGPGWVTIFAGLALLGTEFAWARWVLKQAKTRVTQAWEATKAYTGITPQTTTDVPTSPPVSPSPSAKGRQPSEQVRRNQLRCPCGGSHRDGRNR